MTNLIRIPIFILLLFLNTSFHGTLVSLCAPIKFMIPIRAWRQLWGKISYWIAGGFIITNNFLLNVFFHIEWDIEGLDNLSPDGTYLVISNHLSLLDIPVAQGMFFWQIPFLRFFIKQELVFVPFLGRQSIQRCQCAVGSCHRLRRAGGCRCSHNLEPPGQRLGALHLRRRGFDAAKSTRVQAIRAP